MSISNGTMNKVDNSIPMYELWARFLMNLSASYATVC